MRSGLFFHWLQRASGVVSLGKWLSAAKRSCTPRTVSFGETMDADVGNSRMLFGQINARIDALPDAMVGEVVAPRWGGA